MAQRCLFADKATSAPVASFCSHIPHVTGAQWKDVFSLLPSFVIDHAQMAEITSFSFSFSPRSGPSLDPIRFPVTDPTDGKARFPREVGLGIGEAGRKILATVIKDTKVLNFPHGTAKVWDVHYEPSDARSQYSRPGLAS